MITAESPVVYILHGDDEFAMTRAVADLYKAMGDLQSAEMNTVKLEGSQATPGEIKNAAATVPFLASHRLVIVNHPLARISDKDSAARSRFLSMLDSLPTSAVVVLVIEDYQEKKKWKLVPPDGWLATWAKETGQRVNLQEMRSPERKNMAGWILQEAKQQGGEFKPNAAAALADQIDNDTRFAAGEITKLLTYVNYQRPVEREDIDLLTSGKTQVSIFELTDALAERNSRKALTLLHHLMELEDPRNIFAMVIRQFRLLIQAREIIDEGGRSQDIMNAGLSSGQMFIADKLLKQAGGFRMQKLKDTYRRLLEFDISSKTSDLNLDLALDLLIVEVSEKDPTF